MTLALLVGCGTMVADGDAAIPVKKELDIKYARTIHPNSHMGVWKFENIVSMTYSPDGRYLALLYVSVKNPSMTIVVWDLQKDREQSSITSGLNTIAYSGGNLLWDPKGDYIMIGSAGGDKFPLRIYDPMTGQLKKEISTWSMKNIL